MEGIKNLSTSEYHGSPDFKGKPTKPSFANFPGEYQQEPPYIDAEIVEDKAKDGQ
jgi:hypothetical protein